MLDEVDGRISTSAAIQLYQTVETLSTLRQEPILAAVLGC